LTDSTLPRTIRAYCGLVNALAQRGHKSDGQKDIRDGQQHVHDPHDDCIRAAAPVAGDRPEERADSQGNDDGGDADRQGDMRPVDDP